MTENRCLFCGEPTDAHHWRHCDGRQGAIEAEENFPLLAAGLTPDTYETSIEAALQSAPLRIQQRRQVFEVIRRAGWDGCTDDEVQQQLGLDGSSERPRRWELWHQGLIEVRRDAFGHPVRRTTRTHRQAVVWIATR